MRIDYLADAYTGSATGTETLLLLLIRGMVERSHDVRLFVMRHTPYTRLVQNFPCPIECLEVGSMASVETVRRMMRFRSRVRRDSTDVVHAFFNDGAILAPIFLKDRRNRVFTSRRDMGFWNDRKARVTLRLANRRVDRIVCNSRAVADQVRRREGAPPERLSIICSSLSLGAMLDAHEGLYTDGVPVKADAMPLHTPVPYGTVTPDDRAELLSRGFLGNSLDPAREACWTIREWTEEEFASGRESWEALLAQSEADRLFMSWEWQHGWWKHFAESLGLRLQLVALYDQQGALAGLAPFYVSRERLPSGFGVTRFAPIGTTWGNTSAMRSEYISLIVRNDVLADAPRKLFSRLWDTTWDELVVRDWNPKAPGDDALNEIIGARSLMRELTEPLLDETRFISLEHGFDHYVAQLSGNARRALLNQRKYLESLGPRRMEYADADEVVQYFRDLNRLHAMRWGEHVFTGARLDFHIELATRLAKEGRLRFSRLSIDSEVVSVLYHLRSGKREYNLQMGFNDKFHAHRISLGLLHLGYAIEEAASDGIQAVDLLAGGGKQGLFKQRFAPETQQLVRRRYARSHLSRASVTFKATLSRMARALDHRSRN